ncbi:MAG: 5'-nucleotidase C-terminal domain-containing protein [Bacteroidales bacterium]|nr:5'-nucleotidase C-terminal domain-containing protein [Bacteroidales bacterium]
MRNGIVYLAALILSTGICLAAGPQKADSTAAPNWKAAKIDGHRTGVTAPSKDNVKTAIGTVEKGVYTAPNGRVFKKGATPAVARLMIDAQPAMAPVKEVLGYSEQEMKRYRPQCELSNWFTDFLRAKTAELTGRKVDVAIYNFGGIRTDMPQGNITVDDVMSMFPFRNTLCYVALKGSDLRAIFDFLARTGMQAVSGVQLVVRNHRLESVKVGGEPLDDKKTYGVATINFLLTGGDGLFIARNAQELIDSGVYVKDALIPYIQRLTRESTAIIGRLDDRVAVFNDELENKEE